MKQFLFTLIILILPLPTTAQVLNNPISKDGGNLRLTTIIGSIVQIILSFAGLVAAVYILIGGIQIITAIQGGDKDNKYNKGKRTLFYAIIGLLVAFGGFVITNAVLQGIGTIFGIGN